jgi:hypothetical protein
VTDQRTVLMLAAECSRLETQNAHLHHLISLLADAAHQEPYERHLTDRLLALIDDIKPS